MRTIEALQNCPSREVWAAELDHLVDEPVLSQHIERCAKCRRVLDELAADPLMWKEASETLAMRPADLSHLTNSICPLSYDLAGTTAADPLNEHEIAQLQGMLAPASHPELLARIGRYELEQLIGRGGMGLVFRAWDAELHRVVAVKTLAFALMPMGTARERFIREGRAAAMLNHPNIVPMYDVIPDRPVPALVMQYIAGPTLERWVAEHGPMPWQDALRVGAQLADALDAAHTEGLVHRDIKPSNVLLEAGGTRALLTDFGLVRAIDDAALTHSGMLAGTPHFMSPEQARSEAVDCRSDLFSLGSLLYFAMTGQPPFRGREPMAVLNSLCHTLQTPLCQVDCEIPIEVSRLVDRMLSKQPAKRPASSRQVRDELRALLLAPRRLRRKRKLSASSTRRLWMLSGTAGALLLASMMLWLGARPFDPGRFDRRAWQRLDGSSATSWPGAVDGEPVVSSDPGLPGSTDQTEHAASTARSSSGNEFTDIEELAHQSAELEAMIDAYRLEPSRPLLDEFVLRQPFENFSREAAAVQYELERLRASETDAIGSTHGP